MTQECLETYDVNLTILVVLAKYAKSGALKMFENIAVWPQVWFFQNLQLYLQQDTRPSNYIQE